MSCSSSQKTCCESESNTSVRVVFANWSGFDAPIGVVLAWEERGSCLNIFRTTNREGLRNLHELRGKRQRLVAQVSQTRRFANRSGFDAPIGVVLAWEERGSCLNILRTTNRGRVSETFTNYEAKDLLRKGSVDRVLTYSDDKSRSGLRNLHELRGKRLVAKVCQTRRFANRSGFDAPIGVVVAWEERGSCLNIFRSTNRGRVSETFTYYEAKDLLRNCFLAWVERGSVLTYSDDKSRSGLRNLHELRREKTCCESESNRRFALYSRTGVVLMLQLESSWHGRSVDHVLTYSGRKIPVGSQKPSRVTRQKTCCASESNTSVCVVFANWSGFDAPIGVVLAWEERGSCLNILRTIYRGRVSETFTNYEAKDLLLVLAWEERGSCLNIFRTTNRGRVSDTFTNYEAKDLLRNRVSETLMMNEAKDLLRSESNTSVALYLRTGVVLMVQLESSWHGRSVDHVLTYSGRQIAVGSQKPSRITMQKACCASESNTSVRVVFANRSGFDAPIGVVLAWEERGSGLNIFWTTSQKPSRITRQKTCCESESNTSVRVVFANWSGFDAPIGSFLAWGSVDHVLTYSGRQIAVGSQKLPRITRQ
ncbi:uncharacterized protein G2W53_044920 [Senna tora]|uniref:Uncharacterized protein n=1 Tax=Senna tora TaxID=362788 RepID=A0A834VXX0_9FABA|nr:uncharacterized protein G2W53_044920 [Senna tora]